MCDLFMKQPGMYLIILAINIKIPCEALVYKSHKSVGVQLVSC